MQTFKWWVEHANNLEKERDIWRTVAMNLANQLDNVDGKRIVEQMFNDTLYK